ncbi:MAG: LPS export ABC transporter periplasmic protein LptC [Emcibacteraceae bacterium]|nr:LPS export ABC transporter periplasmic protein LptC [Emcibacteraceae bacterium]
MKLDNDEKHWKQNIVNTHHDHILESNEAVTFDENERQINRAEQLKKMVPILTLIAFLCLVLYPILSTRENSFTLAIDKLPKRDEKAKLIKPSYVDIDSNNNPINISAESATREENEHTDYFFTKLIANLSLPTGEGITILADNGTLNTDTQIMDLNGEIVITSETGLQLRSTQATFAISEKIATGKNGVTGVAPFGRFSANNFKTDVEKQIIILDGNVTIKFDPNKPMNIFEKKDNTTAEGNSN